MDEGAEGLEGGTTRRSDAGQDLDEVLGAHQPAVACGGATDKQYLAVWSGDDFEIWGQRFSGVYVVHLPLMLRHD